MTKTKITRRQAFKIAVTTLVSYITVRASRLSDLDTTYGALPETSSLAGNVKDVLVGVVQRLELPRGLFLLDSKGLAQIRFAVGAAFWRAGLGRTARLEDFVSQDEVVAEGKWLNSTFAGTALLSLYRLVEVRILAKQGDRLQTTEGVVYLTPNTVSRRSYAGWAKPLSDLSVG